MKTSIVVLSSILALTAALPLPAGADETAAETASAIERNKAAMRRFETCINENDLELGHELISATAASATPVSPEPLYGAGE